MAFPDDLLPDTLSCSDPVYHYTSAAGFLGTVEAHALWATEAFGLNDVAELRHGWAFIRNRLEALDPEDQVIQDFLNWVPDEDDPNIALGVFMCCASTLPDDASQWRLYADGARGYAIELDSTEPLGVLARMEAFTDGEPPKQGNRSWGTLIRDSVSVSPWLRVLYSDTEKEEALGDLLELAHLELGKAETALARGADPDEVGSLYEVYQELAQAALVTLAQCMKTNAFRGESEVRVIATFSWSDDHSYFRSTPYGVVRYVRLIATPGRGQARGVQLEHSSPPNLPVKSVRLGPAQVVQNSSDATKSLLRRNGYPPVVFPSSAALR